MYVDETVEHMLWVMVGHALFLTPLMNAAHQWHPQHSLQSSAETGSDWLIPSTGNGSQTAQH